MARTRDYARLIGEAASLSGGTLSLEERVLRLTESLWEALKTSGVDWLGFYFLDPEGNSMLLHSCRPKPACSPIGLHGVCGRAWKERRAQVVSDVYALGAAHIACDPSNLSEIVVPLIAVDGSCTAVLDLDSRELDAFSDADSQGLTEVLRAAGLSS